MSTILASSSNAAAATTTTNAFAFGANDTIMTQCTNGATPPNVGCDVVLQLSPDGVNWYSVDRRHFGVAPSQTYYQAFELSQYTGGQVGGSPTALGVAEPANGWLDFRLVFSGNDTQAVTIQALGGDVVEVAVITLTGTTSTSGGGIASWAPPGGNAIIIDRVILNVTTASTGSANITVGWGSSATTSYTNLIPATSVHATGTIDHITASIIAATAAESGINQLAPLVPGTDYLTFTGSASTAGMVGTAYIRYVRP